MLREMGTFGAVMTVILLVLIAIKSILHYLNPKGENNDQTKRYRKHRRFVFGFLSIATLILGAYIITSIKNPELFQKINESTTPGFIYGSRLLVKLLATVAEMSIIAIVLIMFLGMAFCGARTIWYAAFNNKDKFDETRRESQSLLQEAIREPMVKIVLTISVFAAFIVIPLFCGSEGKGMVECWKTGVCYIGDLILKGESVPSNPATSLSVSVAVYIVLYVVICGTFFGAANIVYIIFDDFLTKASGRGFLREYSNSIGLLAIGIAMLSSVFLGKTDSNSDLLKLVGNALKSMAVVILLFAVVVMVLEIINLLMDMRDTLLREESGLIFIYLVLLGSALLANVLHSLYLAVSSLFVTSDGTTARIEKIYEDILDGMCDAVDQKVERLRNRYKYTDKATFRFFNSKITRK